MFQFLMKGGAVLVLAVNIGTSARMLVCSGTSHGLISCFKVPKRSKGGSVSKGESQRDRPPVSVDLKPNKVFDQSSYLIFPLSLLRNFC